MTTHELQAAIEERDALKATLKETLLHLDNWVAVLQKESAATKGTTWRSVWAPKLKERADAIRSTLALLGGS